MVGKLVSFSELRFKEAERDKAEGEADMAGLKSSQPNLCRERDADI